MTYQIELVEAGCQMIDFITLPDVIYGKGLRPHTASFELSVLEGENTIASKHEHVAFICRDTHGDVTARCAIFDYPNGDAYIGFFDTSDDSAAQTILEYVSDYAAQHGKARLLGPIDASIWISYRFYENGQCTHYTGAPTNPPEYCQMWERAGYKVCERYRSLFAHFSDDVPQDMKAKRRLERAIKNGYTFEHPKRNEFNGMLDRIYTVAIDGFASLPGYEHLSYSEFANVFSSLKWLLDYDMVYEVYDANREYAAFLVCIPDYGSALLGALTLPKIMRILTIRKQPQRYIAMYMGVAKGHEGLGGALAQLAREGAERKNADAIFALIHTGKASGIWHKDTIVDQASYVLLEKRL